MHGHPRPDDHVVDRERVVADAQPADVAAVTMMTTSVTGPAMTAMPRAWRRSVSSGRRSVAGVDEERHRHRRVAGTASPGAPPSARWRSRRSSCRAPPSRGSTGSGSRRCPNARGGWGCRGSSSVRPVATIRRRADRLVPSSRSTTNRPSSRRRAPVAAALDELHAVSGDLGAALLEVLHRRESVVAEHAVHVGGGLVPRVAGIDHDDRASRPAQRQRRAETRRASSRRR